MMRHLEVECSEADEAFGNPHQTNGVMGKVKKEKEEKSSGSGLSNSNKETLRLLEGKIQQLEQVVKRQGIELSRFRSLGLKIDETTPTKAAERGRSFTVDLNGNEGIQAGGG
jgi:hypothetical protein